MKENKKVDAKPIVIYIIVQIVVSLISGIVLGILYGSAKAMEKLNDTTGIVLFLIFTILITIFIILYYQRLKEDFKRLQKKDYIIIIVASIGWLILNFILSELFEQLNINMNNQDTVSNALKISSILTFISTVLFGPLVEEIVFRYSISTFFKKDIPFIIISSIIFGAMHTTNIAIILYILMGAVFGIVYVKTNKNVVASSIVHFINNLVAIISMLLVI